MNRIRDDEDLVDADLADFPGLLAVSQFARMLREVPWFATLGEPLDERELNLAEDYLVGLGFAEATVVPAADWQEAEEAVRNPEWNTAFWEAEEQLRVALVTEACERADEATVQLALAHLSNVAAETIVESIEATAAHWQVSDDALIRTAVGAAAQACYQAGLVLAAELDDDEPHPFAVKYRLFESGRWPLGLVGASYYLF